MIPYGAAFVTGALSVICLLYFGRRIIVSRHLARLAPGLPSAGSSLITDRGQVCAEVSDGDEEEEDVYYEAQSELEHGEMVGSNSDRRSGDGGGGMPGNAFPIIGPTVSKQSLVSCESCFCCKVRRAISALFPGKDFHKSNRKVFPVTVSEPILAGIHRRA